jgi:protoheme IX farnesyltransferase
VKIDYANAGVPMLPVVAGERATRIQIGLYTIPMAIAAIAPWPLGLTGPIYGLVALAATAVFGWMAAGVALRRSVEGDTMRPEKKLFAFSIVYLFLLFGAVAVDRWLPL